MGKHSSLPQKLSNHRKKVYLNKERDEKVDVYDDIGKEKDVAVYNEDRNRCRTRCIK